VTISDALPLEADPPATRSCPAPLTRNAPLYQISSKLVNARLSHWWVIDESLMIQQIFAPVFQQLKWVNSSHRWVARLEPIIDDARFLSDFRIAPFLNSGRLRGVTSPKSEPHFVLFTNVKLRGGVGEMFDW